MIYLMSFSKWMTEQEVEWNKKKKQILFGQQNTGSCGEPWSPTSWEDMSHKRRKDWLLHIVNVRVKFLLKVRSKVTHLLIHPCTLLQIIFSFLFAHFHHSQEPVSLYSMVRKAMTGGWQGFDSLVSFLKIMRNRIWGKALRKWKKLILIYKN